MAGEAGIGSLLNRAIRAEGIGRLFRRILKVLRRTSVAGLAHAAVGVVVCAVRRQVDRVPLRLMAIGTDRGFLLDCLTRSWLVRSWLVLGVKRWRTQCGQNGKRGAHSREDG